MNKWPDDDVILFDGVCIFCSRWVRFVATRDTAKRFRFTPIQSDYGTRLARAFGIDPDDPDTTQNSTRLAMISALTGNRRANHFS